MRVSAGKKTLVRELSFVEGENSVGSPYWTMFANPDFVLRMAAAGLELSFRRVVLDPVRGLIVLMTPARAHEELKELAGDAIKEIAKDLQMVCAPLGSTRWRRSSDPPNTGPEPDCCFFIGQQAQEYKAVASQSSDAADNYVHTHAPDLVVEIGVTHIDKEKQETYRRLGVREYWQLDQPRDTPPVVRFLALQGPERRQDLPVSDALPGVTPRLFEEVLDAVRSRWSTPDPMSAVRDVIEAHGAVEARGEQISRARGGAFARPD